MHREEDRYLLEALQFEGVLRACLRRYARNASDVEELLQESASTIGSMDRPLARVGFLAGAELRAGVRNVFNTEPPFDAGATGEYFYSSFGD